MSRTKSIGARRHRKIKSEAKGFKNARRKRVKTAKEAILHAGQYAYVGRKQKKRNFRSLWNIRINAGVREHGLTYNTFISALKKAGIELNRKMLSDIATNDKEGFKALAEEAKSALN